MESSIVASVATVYLSQLADDEQIALTRQTLASREDSLRLTKLRFDNGASSELDFRQAESLVETGRAALAQQLRQRALDDNALQLLVGAPLPADLPAGRALAATTLTPRLDAGLPSELLLRRPEIRQAEQVLRGADANIGAARAAFFPRITLTGSIGVVSAELKGLFTDGRYGWGLGPQIVLPIFDGGRNRANLDVARVGRELAVAQYERAVQTAFRDVADALAARATLDEQLRAQQAQADAEQARFRLSDLRYRNGVSSYLDLLDAQRSLFTAQLTAVQVRAARLQNQVALYKALGGGGRDWPAPVRGRSRRQPPMTVPPAGLAMPHGGSAALPPSAAPAAETPGMPHAAAADDGGSRPALVGGDERRRACTSRRRCARSCAACAAMRCSGAATGSASAGSSRSPSLR